MNPLLDVDVAAPSSMASGKPAHGGDDAQRVAHKVKGLPVSPKKLRHLCNLTKKLYWREAMLQLEFCRKNIAIHVKNGISDAAKLAEDEGLNPARLIVEQCTVGKGQYLKGLDYKAKGRAGVLRKYQSHMYVVLKEVTEAEMSRTKYYGRWRKTQSLLSLPWEERVKQLPRFKPIPGYDPGEKRVSEVFALVGRPPAEVGQGEEGAAGQPSSTRRRDRAPQWQLMAARKKRLVNRWG